MMNKKITVLATLIFVFSLMSVGATESVTDTAVIPVTATVKEKNDSYYLTKGRKFEELTAFISSIDVKERKNTYFLVDKDMMNGYFYRITEYDKQNSELIREYAVAKDKSNVWVLHTGEKAVLIYGNVQSLLKRTKIELYPTVLGVNDTGTFYVNLPAFIPYTLTGETINTAIAKMGEKNAVTAVSEGRTKALLTIRIGKEERQFEKTVAVSSRAYTGMGNGRVGIGIGIGIGGHSRDSIGIGFGDW